jgi:hypothetical protein
MVLRSPIWPVFPNGAASAQMATGAPTVGQRACGRQQLAVLGHRAGSSRPNAKNPPQQEPGGPWGKDERATCRCDADAGIDSRFKQPAHLRTEGAFSTSLASYLIFLRGELLTPLRVRLDDFTIRGRDCRSWQG